jgi:hypothetical protein
MGQKRTFPWQRLMRITGTPNGVSGRLRMVSLTLLFEVNQGTENQ